MPAAATDDVEGSNRRVKLGRRWRASPGAGAELQPDDRPDRRRRVPLPALDDLEAGSLEHRERAVVGVGRGHPSGRWHRPDRPRASSRRGLGRSRWPLQAWPRRRPDRGPCATTTKHTIDQTGVSSTGREDLRMAQPLVVLARREAHPADGAAVAVADEAGRQRSLGEVLDGALRRAVLGRRRIGPVAAAEPEVDAPAPLRVAALLEQRRQVGQAIGRERADVDVGMAKMLAVGPGQDASGIAVV